MLILIRFLRNFREKQEGATAPEYALIVALIAAVIVAAVATLGTEVRELFDFFWD